MSNLLGEVMKKQVDDRVRAVTNDKLTIYDTVQLAKEIEVHKKQERSLMTQVEQQQYVEKVMREELDRLND